MSIRRLPPLNALAAFEAVARHRSFTKAAEELFLTHSAVSQRVALLERHLKGQLLVRSNRTVELTAAGARYLEVVRETLATLNAASEQFSEISRKQLRISVVPAFGSYWLIYRLKQFQALYPNIDIDIQSSTQLANVKAGEADIAVRWGNGDWPGVEKTKLFADALFPVCSEGYRRKLGGIEAPADLQRAVLLRHNVQPWGPWFVKAGLDWSEPEHGFSFNDSALMLQAAADGHGVALARQVLVAPLLEQGQLVRLFDVSITTQRAFYVVYLQQSLQRDEIAHFVAWLESAAKATAAVDGIDPSSVIECYN